MSKNVRTQLGKVIGKSLNGYHARVKPKIDELKFKEQYQGRIIDCLVGEVDDNYIETPEIDSAIVKLEHSKEGLVKVPSIKGKTILVDADGNETDTPAEGCRLVSVGEEEDNKLIILSKNSDSSLHHKTEILLDKPLHKINETWFDEIVDNKVIYNTKKRVLNGSENWYEVVNSPNPQIDTKLFILSLPHNSFKSTNFKSSCFNFVNVWMQDEEGMQLENQKDIRINISRERLGNKTINQWLSENPIELIYVSNEPTIIEMPNALTLQGFDDTTMYIENSITPIVQYGYNALIPYKEELRTQKEEVETNTLDIEQNIIPYLMDMEFNLMLMEDN